MASPVKDADWLEWIASLLGAGPQQTQTAMLPRGQFHCLLDELPLHLIPRVALDLPASHEDEQPLFLNPQCSVFPPGQVPTEFESDADLLAAFNLQLPIAWVRDSATRCLLPFWLGARMEEQLSRFGAGEPASSSTSSMVRRTLVHAGILIRQHETDRRSAQWSKAVQKSSILFREKNYAPLRNLLHPFHIAALRRYYRHAIRRGAIRLGDEQSSRRYAAYNEPVARFFHHQLASTVAAVVGEPVKPSYVYLASYLSGAALQKHTDRPQCEFSVTLCLDFSPEPILATSWPIRLDTPEGTIAVYQALGDGLIYRGTAIPHYRDPLPPGHTSTSVFFHYVPAHFSGALQ
jgi:hypothetical protein